MICEKLGMFLHKDVENLFQSSKRKQTRLSMNLKELEKPKAKVYITRENGNGIATLVIQWNQENSSRLQRIHSNAFSKGAYARHIFRWT
jgi:hypothetical protein